VLEECVTVRLSNESRHSLLSPLAMTRYLKYLGTHEAHINRIYNPTDNEFREMKFIYFPLS
jgi:hypothetical protein